MTIKRASELGNEKMRIDLTGPEGNVFVLMGYATKLAKQLHKNGEAICSKMQEGDYEHAVKVFEAEFGDYVDLYR